MVIVFSFRAQWAKLIECEGMFTPSTVAALSAIAWICGMAGLTANWYLLCFLHKKALHSLLTHHVLPGPCVLCALNVLDLISAPMGSCLFLQLYARGVCLRNTGMIQ